MTQILKHKECGECGKQMWFAESEETWYCEDSNCGNFEEMSLQEQLDKLLLERVIIDEEISDITRQLNEENGDDRRE